jgi:hypothetical protein
VPRRGAAYLLENRREDSQLIREVWTRCLQSREGSWRMLKRPGQQAIGKEDMSPVLTYMLGKLECFKS